MSEVAISKDLISMRKKVDKLTTQISKTDNPKQAERLEDKLFILLEQMVDICIEHANYTVYTPENKTGDKVETFYK